MHSGASENMGAAAWTPSKSSRPVSWALKVMQRRLSTRATLAIHVPLSSADMTRDVHSSQFNVPVMAAPHATQKQTHRCIKGCGGNVWTPATCCKAAAARPENPLTHSVSQLALHTKSNTG